MRNRKYYAKRCGTSFRRDLIVSYMKADEIFDSSKGGYTLDPMEWMRITRKQAEARFGRHVVETAGRTTPLHRQSRVRPATDR